MGGGELVGTSQDDMVDELYIGIVPILMAKATLFPQCFPTRIHPRREQNFSKGMMPQVRPREKDEPQA